MSAVSPWRGSVIARALWLDPTVPDARRRVLAAWATGARLHALDGGWLLVLARPVRLDAATAPGLVLIERDGALLGCEAAAGRGEVVLPRGGAPHRAEVDRLPPVDPAAWLDLENLVVVDVRTLGAPPRPPDVTPERELRELLGRAPLPTASAALVDALARPAEPGWWAATAASVLAWLRGPTRAPSGLGALAGATPPEPTAWQRWLDRIGLTLFGSLLGASHGRYLQQLLDLFDQGDLDEALRRAIPLSDRDGGGGRLAWAPPRPRTDLRLGGAVGGGPSVGLGLAAYDHLKKTYLRALDRLLAQGRLQEAVFLLVELLRDHDRAVALLEQHGDFRLAAEIAEASKLPSAVAVRLWMRAGDTERALALARRTGTFAVAVEQLKASDPELAVELRFAWAEHLARLGDVAQACTVAWAEPRLRPRAVPWLDAALASGTPAGAALIGALLRQTPETFALARERVEALLTGDAPDRVRLRMGLAEGLVSDGGPHGTRLLRPVLRRLLEDLQRLPELVPSVWVARIAGRIDEPALTNDLPDLRVRGRELAGRSPALAVVVPTGDVGAVPVADVAWLDDGAVLVALGQVGVRAYGGDGRERARFDAPATALVPQPGTLRALAVQQRSFGRSVSRLDLGRRTAEPWHDGPYRAFAAEAHHGAWFVATEDAVLALDLAADAPRALWRLGDPGGPVLEPSAGPDAFACVVGQERWLFSAPQVQLRHRVDLFPSQDEGLFPPTGWVPALEPSGTAHLAWVVSSAPPAADAWVVPPMDRLVLLALPPHGRPTAEERVGLDHLAGRPWRVTRLVTSPAWRAVVLKDDDGVAVAVLPARTSRIVLTVELTGATTAAVRLTRSTGPGPADHLVIGDDRGRVLAFELGGGRCVRDVRVR